MRRAVTALALLLVLASVGWSQTTCVDTNQCPIDTLTIDVSLGAHAGIISEVWVTRSSGGQIQYVINVPSIHFTGDGAVVDAMSTGQIFDLLSTATVSQGIANGYTSCPGSCSSPATAVVRIPACVKRSGSGTATFFTVCDGSGCCVRTYLICCPINSSAPTITLGGSSSPGCSGSVCEPTCP